MRIVIAIGGNALLQKGEPLEADILKYRCEKAAECIAPLAKKHNIVIVHGNGPQVGLLALQSASYKETAPYPFDILDAESQGMIGYMLQQALMNMGASAVSMLTQVEIDANDRAFELPSKPIGPFYSINEKNHLEKTTTWQFIQRGEQFRRVVPSPKPKRIIELSAVNALIDSGHLVIAAGGGGIPCVDINGQLHGVEAVVDKDLSAACLALAINADKFIILTDVDGVYEGWHTPKQHLIKKISIMDLQQHTFETGSMGPKVEAASQFSKASGKPSVIGHLDKLSEIIAGDSGTRISINND